MVSLTVGEETAGSACRTKIWRGPWQYRLATRLRICDTLMCCGSACDRPRVIESLRGKEVVDVAAGGAHSACVTSAGELFTWGKGRYGRLGHGDSDDQSRPKLVCALCCNTSKIFG